MRQTWWVAAILVSACGGDRSDDEVAKEANSSVEACADPREWPVPNPAAGGIPFCVSPCVRRPAVNAAVLPDPYRVCCVNGQPSCQAERWFLVEGVPGVCLLGLEAIGGGLQFDDRIMWQHCRDQL